MSTQVPEPAVEAATEIAAKRPLRRDAERNRQRILEAASELFAERGVSVTADDVADRAGVGVGTVYRRFKDRDAIIDAVFEQRIERLGQMGRDALEIEDPWEALVYFLRSQVELQLHDRAFAAVLLSNAHGRDAVTCAKEQIKPIVYELVRRAHVAKAVRADFEVADFPMLVMMLASVVNATRDMAPDVWQRYFAIVLDGIRPDSTTPLMVGALTPEQVPEAMRCGLARR